MRSLNAALALAVALALELALGDALALHGGAVVALALEAALDDAPALHGGGGGHGTGAVGREDSRGGAATGTVEATGDGG